MNLIDPTNIEGFIVETIGNGKFLSSERIQSLWSGYGEIKRIYLSGEISSVIAKIIDTRSINEHPRGWNTNLSHKRKVKSYKVEEEWYKNWSGNSQVLKYPQLLNIIDFDGMRIILLEDLNNRGYTDRKTDLILEEVKNCIHWLADFHATFLNQPPCGLWEKGTYWHLGTRSNEWDSMAHSSLKTNAKRISHILDSCTYQTIVHGDAKVANFCFSPNGDVAGVDFQYVGKGCGMKDYIYFIGSCLTESQCFEQGEYLLEFYFDCLKRQINDLNHNINFNALEKEWRKMYSFAWADFSRFLLGWMPGHQKLNRYTDLQTLKTLKKLEYEK
ncbi:MAG: DUF1679 domain-containing protein [Crocinitomicaceae bacterium]|nr:DUF1679 domain-containing protein [Crocinitomicaceae bacterium]